MHIIRRNNCIYVTLGTCYSVWMTGMQGGMKHTKKNCATSWLYLQDYTSMHGQQNIKFIILYGKLTAADYKNFPKYIHHHHYHHHRSGVSPWSIPFRLIFSPEFFPIVFAHLVHISPLFFILLSSILVTCRDQSGLYLLSLTSVGSTHMSSRISSCRCGQKGCTTLFFWKISSRLMSTV